MARLILNVVSPQGAQEALACDSVRLLTPDDSHGEHGGWVGIRPGHTPALLAVEPGPVLAFRDGQEISRMDTVGGFASVKDNVITVITR